MRSPAYRILLCALLSASVFMAGCAGSSPKAQKLNPSFDDCAQRLHDISGALLLYYSAKYRLPQQLEELRALPGFDKLEFVCPVSRQPYAYFPDGIVVHNQEAKVILYDSTPSHSGFRWSLQMTPGEAGQPPFSTVVPLPEEWMSVLSIK